MNQPSTPVTIVDPGAQELVGIYIQVKTDAGLANSTIKEYRRLLACLVAEFPTVPLDPDVLQGFIKRHSGPAYDSHRTTFRAYRTFYRSVQ